ncbi:MAG: hypothetical protein AB1796_12345 [Bacillota bacterium]
MEPIFIFFIIYIIFSIISRVTKAVAGQKGFPQPSQATRPVRSLTREPEQQREILEEREEPMLPVEAAPVLFSWPQQAETVDQANTPQVIVTAGEKRPGKTASPRFTPAPRQQEAPCSPVKKKIYRAAGAKLGLEQFLRRENLPRAVIAAEVLSAPRCRRPLSRRGI